MLNVLFSFGVLLIPFLISPADAQEQQVQRPLDTIGRLSIDTARVSDNRPKRKFFRAAGEVALVQVLPWAYSYYITKTDFAKISFKTLSHHLKLSSWAWDGDGFTTNQFSHPYHGSLYFNSFRTNGYDLLPASLATLSGSLLWELAGETQSPSLNDLINTTFGGIVLGEMTHRLSNKLVNNRSIGFRRQVNEISALLINPMNGLNRILDRKWGKPVVQNTEIDSFKMDAQFDMGFRRISPNQHLISKGSNVLYGRMRFVYEGLQGDKKPFDAFSMDVEVGLDDSALVNTLSVYGLLYGKELVRGETVRHQAILSANYDLFHNSSFFYGGQSVKMNLVSEFKMAHRLSINTSLGLGTVLLAAIPDQYMNNRESRHYDYGSGLSLGGKLSVEVLDRIKLGLLYTGGMVATISGNHSHYALHALSSELSIMPLKPFSVNISAGYFVVNGDYRDFPDIKKRYSFGRISLGYQLFF